VADSKAGPEKRKNSRIPKGNMYLKTALVETATAAAPPARPLNLIFRAALTTLS